MTENPYSAPYVDQDRRSPAERPYPLLRLLLKCGAVVVVLSVLGALMLPAKQRVRQAAVRTQCENNLKQIMLALHNYHDNYRSFPPAFTVDANGQPLHSWRTLLLPFLEHQKLYNLIDLSKPWNDPANATAFQTTLHDFHCPSDKNDGILTTYQAVIGPGAGFESTRLRTIQDFQDGTDRTILVVEVEPAWAVHWMSPFDHGYEYLLTFRPDVKTSHSAGTYVGVSDGTIRFISNQLDLQTRRALISIAGGETIGDW